MEATNSMPQSKAKNWREYDRVLLPPIQDLHKLEVYEKEYQGYEAIRDILGDSDRDPEAVTDEMKAANVRGRGGAGFNAGLKWSFMPEPDDRPRYLACNADESEPGTFKDRQLMEYNPHLLFEGILIANYAMQIDACYIYTRGEYVDWIMQMQRELDKLHEKGYLGENIFGSDFSTEIILHKGAGAYICGEETSLLESLEGKRGYPRTKPPFPAQSGLWGYPTTVNNVETLSHAVLVMRHGADWFTSIGAESHPGPTLYGISGHVERPGVYEFPTGMLITDLIDEVAGGVRDGKDLKAVIPGGVSTPPLRADMIDGVTMDAESLTEAGSLMGTGGMLVLDEETDMVSWLRRVAHFFQHESCGQCTPCREGTGWIEQVLARLDEGNGRVRDLDLLLDLSDQIEGRTVCAFGDASIWPVRNAINRFRDEFEAHCTEAAYTDDGAASIQEDPAVPA